MTRQDVMGKLSTGHFASSAHGRNDIIFPPIFFVMMVVMDYMMTMTGLVRLL